MPVIWEVSIFAACCVVFDLNKHLYYSVGLETDKSEKILMEFLKVSNDLTKIWGFILNVICAAK